MSYPTSRKLQYGVTPAQESTRTRPHVPLLFRVLCCTCHPEIYGRSRLTRSAVRLECLQRAALQKAALFVFSKTSGTWFEQLLAPVFGSSSHSAVDLKFAKVSQVVIAMNNSATSHLLPVFARVDLGFTHGEGCWLYATNGERYLDFTSGVAVNALGHAHPHLVAALTEQAQKLWHVSNLYEIPESERVAQRLCAASFADVAFFCNSGAEAMEGAIKCARKYQYVSGHPERFRIVTFEGAFHGRTLATLAAGGQKKYLEGFGPVVEGFDQMPFGDLDAVKHAITDETAAILIEP